LELLTIKLNKIITLVGSSRFFQRDLQGQIKNKAHQRAYLTRKFASSQFENEADNR